MSEYLEKFIKIISTLIAIITLLFGVYKYQENSELEFRRSIYNEKLEAYNDIMDLGSEIINTSIDSLETEAFLAHYGNYKKLHYGKLNLVCDSIVNRNSYTFLFKLEKYRRPGSRVDKQEMDRLLVSLGIACKKSLHDTWVVDVDKILKGH